MRTTRILLGILLVAAAARPAAARSLSPEAIALGHQTERADLVAVGTLRTVAPLSFALTETIRGSLAAGETVAVRWPGDEALPAGGPGAAFLLFLTRLPGEPAVFAPLSGPASVLAVAAEGVEARFPEIVRRFAATFPEGARPGDPRARLALLLALMEEEDAGLSWSAAVDFAAWEDLPPLLDEAGRGRVLGAFRDHPAGKADKEALARAVGAARPAGAVEGLLDALSPEGGTSLRGAIADALVRLNDPAAPARILDRLATAEEAILRADLLSLLGAVGGAEALAAVRAGVTGATAAERIEAAHAAGLIARRIREAEPGTAVAGRRELAGLLAVAGTDGERKAALWGLAQLDDPEAYALLSRLAEEDPREFVRRHAKLYLDRPRLSLVLDGSPGLIR